MSTWYTSSTSLSPSTTLTIFFSYDVSRLFVSSSSLLSACYRSDNNSSISNAASASTSTFTTALVFNAAVFGAELAIFTLVRPYFPAIYQPRTYVPPEE